MFLKNHTEIPLWTHFLQSIPIKIYLLMGFNYDFSIPPSLQMTIRIFKLIIFDCGIWDLLGNEYLKIDKLKIKVYQKFHMALCNHMKSLINF